MAGGGIGLPGLGALDPLSAFSLQQGTVSQTSNFANSGQGPGTNEALALSGNQNAAAQQTFQDWLTQAGLDAQSAQAGGKGGGGGGFSGGFNGGSGTGGGSDGGGGGGGGASPFG